MCALTLVSVVQFLVYHKMEQDILSKGVIDIATVTDVGMKFAFTSRRANGYIIVTLGDTHVRVNIRTGLVPNVHIGDKVRVIHIDNEHLLVERDPVTNSFIKWEG